MHTTPTKEKNHLIQKVLTVNSFPCIQFFTASQSLQGALLKKESLLLFVTSGVFHLRIGKEQRCLQKGEMAFLAKDTLVEYSVEAAEVNAIEYVVVTLTANLVKEFAKIAALPVYASADREPLVTCTIDTGLQKYLDFLHLYFGQAEKVEESLVKIKLLELLFYLSRYYLQILVLILDVKDSYRPDVTQAVEENILNSVSMSQLAFLSGRSLSSFRRDFLAIYKMPPSQWIRQKRLEKAKELLQSTSMSITDICYTTGFENIAHFSRLFKSHFNQAPSAFRQNSFSA